MIEAIHGVINAISGFLYQPYIVPLFLVAAGLYFTVRTGLLQIRLFGESIKVVNEKPKDKKSVSSFGALMVSTASRVGTGNIIGVSTAICLGGFGAIFWMWITAILGGASAFIESTLAQIYKHKDSDGTYYGGPSYYMQNALKQRWLGIIFAVILILTYVVGYNMLASFNTQDTFKTFSFYDPSKTPIIIGAILAVLFALCVLGGGKRLTNITGILVPVMGLIYIVVSLIVVIMNITNLPLVLKNIFVAAFDFKAIFGGFAGSCMMWGIKRGLYSNEAGMGSTPHAHAQAKVKCPHEQGVVAMIGVFIDTFVVLTMTALVVISTLYTGDGILSGVMTSSENLDALGVAKTNLAQLAFGSVFGESFGSAFVAICLLFFAFTTIIGWNLFGRINIEYLFGKKAVLPYSIIAIAFIFLGSLLSNDLVWELTDMFNQLMVIPNVIALLALGGLVAASAKAGNSETLENVKK